jgi:hypothetical protein
MGTFSLCLRESFILDLLECLALICFISHFDYYGHISSWGATLGQKLQLQNLSSYAILSWHAGLAPEIGFSAPSMEQLWWIVLKCNHSIITQTASLICTLNDETDRIAESCRRY